MVMLLNVHYPMISWNQNETSINWHTTHLNFIKCYYMASSVSGQDESNPGLWLANHSGLPAVSCKKNFHESHIINPLLTKLVWSRCLDIGLVLFCMFMDLNSVSVHKHAEKELGQYPAILTSCLVNNPYLRNSVACRC